MANDDVMPPLVDLAAALQALATAIQNLQPAVPAAPAAPAVPLLDPFQVDQPFDLSSRVGSAAFTTASSALDVTWDGIANQFPSFVIALAFHSSQ